MNKNRYLKSVLLVFTALFVSLSSASSGEAPAGNKKLRVLFVGNSLTFMNDLPKLTAELAKDRGSVMEYEMYAPGGYTFAQHSRDPRLLKLIRKGGWDFVVLQDQSLVPAYPRAKTEVFPYAQKLAGLVRAANPLAQIAFYETMAKKNGDRKHLRDFPEMGTYAGLQKKLNEAYVLMVRENQGVLVPVGEVWQKMRSEHPSFDLYGDEVHPNLAGTYLAACVFYAVLYNDTPVGLKPPPGIDQAAAEAIQGTAEVILRPKK